LAELDREKAAFEAKVKRKWAKFMRLQAPKRAHVREIIQQLR
jgi:hypothetical protein